MANQIVRVKESEDELQHYGVMGMKWGVRKANYQTGRLSKKVSKTTKRFDKGKAPDTTKISKKVRRRKYKVDRAIKRAERFLSKNAKANASEVVNRYNKDPSKKPLVENYIKSMQLNSVSLAELRLQLIDIRV